MISILLTAYKEPKTIGKAINAFTTQLKNQDYELLVAAPDIETKNVVEKFAIKNKKIKYVQDPGKGKPTALNILFKKAKGDLLVLSDGDVYVSNNSLKHLIEPFKNKEIGAVSGRPISNSSRNNMLGYWSHLLTDVGAHMTRIKRAKRGDFIVCSGYLYAIRKGLIKEIPRDVLSDDAIISHQVFSKGYKIAYASKALVYVNYPLNFKDWIKQKKRSAGGYTQIKQYFKENPRMRTFSKEAFEVFSAFSYAKTFKEAVWTFMLVIARVYLWFLIFIGTYIKKKKFKEIWVRVESTK